MLRHIYSSYFPQDSETEKKRLQSCAFTWRGQKWEERPVDDKELPRMFVEGKKQLPFVRDIIDVGSKNMLFNDIIVFTNSDTCVSSDCAKQIEKRLKKLDACYCFRKNFSAETFEISDEQIKSKPDWVGSDLHAFKVSWWKENRKNYPNMVLGREGIDAIFRVLIDEGGDWPKTKLDGLIWHIAHEPYWEAPDIRYRLPGNRLNVQLAKTFLEKRGISPEKFSFK